VVDTGTWNQIKDFGPFLKSLSCAKMVIDHHRTQDDLGGPHLVDTSAEAAGRLIYEACLALGVAIDAEIAKCPLPGPGHRHRWFRHSNTTPRTFALAEKLTQAGANPNALFDALYDRNPLGRLRLAGRLLERLATTNGGQVAYSEIYIADYGDTGSTPPDTEDLIDYPRSVEEPK